MQFIYLTQGQVAEVDDSDFLMLSQWKWCARFDKTTNSYYAIRGVYNPITSKVKEIKMARFILGLTDPAIKADHKDGNTLNNQRYNLRRVSNRESAINRKKFKNNTSGYKCISWKEANKKWQLQINGKYEGVFDSLEEAVVVRDKKCKDIQGEFIRND